MEILIVPYLLILTKKKGGIFQLINSVAIEAIEQVSISELF